MSINFAFTPGHPVAPPGGPPAYKPPNRRLARADQLFTILGSSVIVLPALSFSVTV